MIDRRGLFRRASLIPFALLPWRAFAAPQLACVPVAGHCTAGGVRLWIRGLAAGTVRLAWWPAPDRAGPSRALDVELRAADGYCATVEVDGLRPATRYRYRASLSDQDVATGAFRTASAPDAPPRDFRVYLGSCLYTESHTRGGTPYGAKFHILDTMASSMDADPLPHFMLWLGDTLYLRAPSRSGAPGEHTTPELMRARYEEVRGMAMTQRLFAATHHYAIWDDHEYGPNNADRHFVLKEESLRLFGRFWPNPLMGSAALPGTWTRFAQEDAEFFLLDGRFNRDPETAAPSEAKQMYGPEQLSWLKRGLAASKATFKIIAGGSQFLSELPNGVQSGWHSYAAERDGFLAWLAKSRIPGVALLSGDRHNTQFFRHAQDGESVVNEFSCSPLTSRVSKLTAAERANPRLDAGAVVEDQNYGTLEFTGQGRDRRVVARCHDADGRLLWARTLARAGATG